MSSPCRVLTTSASNHGSVSLLAKLGLHCPTSGRNTVHSVLGLCVCRRALGGINWNLCLTVHCNFSRSDGSLYVTLALSLAAMCAFAAAPL